jgi:hypothetical protein
MTMIIGAAGTISWIDFTNCIFRQVGRAEEKILWGIVFMERPLEVETSQFEFFNTLSVLHSSIAAQSLWFVIRISSVTETVWGAQFAFMGSQNTRRWNVRRW